MSCVLFAEKSGNLAGAKCEVCRRTTVNEPRLTFCVKKEPTPWYNVVHVRCVPQAAGVLGKPGRDEVLAVARQDSIDARKLYEELQLLDRSLRSFRLVPFSPNKAFNVFYPSRPQAASQLPPAQSIVSVATTDTTQSGPRGRRWVPPTEVASEVTKPQAAPVTVGGFMDELVSFKFRPLREEKTCSICLEAFLKDVLVVALPCTCVFHKECARQCFCKSDECPNDRLNVREALKKAKQY
jgi:hypothetical protein